MVGRAVALDAAEVATGHLLVAHAEVYPVAGDAHLRLEQQAAPRKLREDLALERRFGLRGSADDCGVEPPALGVEKEAAEQLRPLRRRARRVDLVSLHRGEDAHALARARRQDVEPAPSVLAVQRAEVVAQHAVRVLCVCDAEEHDIALVALYVLKVLDEERLAPAAREERLDRRVLAAAHFKFVLHCELLAQVERADSEREFRLAAPSARRLLFRESHNGVGYAPRLRHVQALPLVHAVGHVLETEAGALAVGLDAGEGVEV